MSGGIAAGLLAGALWGLTFIAPLAAAPYTPFDLTLLRYGVFGLASLALLARQRFAPLRACSRRDLALLVAFGAAGNVAYFIVMSAAVPRASAGLVALIVGCVPVVLGLAGNRGPARVPLRRLALPLLAIAAGLLLVNGATLVQAAQNERALTGVALAFAALALWSWYGFANARALARNRRFSDAQWTALLGVGTLLALVPVLPLALRDGVSMIVTRGLDLRMCVWALVLGLCSSWFATWAWSAASRRLPVSLAAQLIVTETIFALVYEAIATGRMPGVPTMAGTACLLAGVLGAVHGFTSERRGVAQQRVERGTDQTGADESAEDAPRKAA